MGTLLTHALTDNWVRVRSKRSLPRGTTFGLAIELPERFGGPVMLGTVVREIRHLADEGRIPSGMDLEVLTVATKYAERWQKLNRALKRGYTVRRRRRAAPRPNRRKRFPTDVHTSAYAKVKSA